MLEVELAYMDGRLKVEFPEFTIIDKIKPLSVKKIVDFPVFQNAYNKSDAQNYLGSDNLLIVVNDAHRSTPTETILTWFKKLHPSQFNTATFLVACGTHIKPSEQEYKTIFGKLYNEIKNRLSAHDCNAIEELQSIGTDQFGKKVFLNKKIFSHNKVWVINSVEPHYFAGYTGGRKSVIPGLADFKTIERNHNLANSLESAPMKLQGNPVAEHLDAMVQLLDLTNVLSLQLVTDTNKNIVHLVFGSLNDSFEDAVVVAKKVYSHECQTMYDLLLLEVLPPLDRSIYQVQKALENCQKMVKDSGSLLICSGCADGVGSDYFFQLVNNWDREKNCPKNGKLSFGSHKLKRVNDISKRINVYLKSSLKDSIVTKLFYNPVKNITDLIDKLSKQNSTLKVGVVYDAAHMVLQIENKN